MARLTQLNRLATVAVVVLALGAVGALALATGGKDDKPTAQPGVARGSATPSSADSLSPSGASEAAEVTPSATVEAPTAPIAVSASASAGSGTASSTPTAKPKPKPKAKAKPKAKPKKPSPAQAAAVSTGFPDDSNTGVPAGTNLMPYTGPMTITQNGTVIDAKTVSGALIIKAANVTIKNSRINGRVSSDGGGSVTILDSNVDGGNQETFPSVSYSNLNLRRVEVVGGQHSVQCSDNCTVTDSWLHGQYIARNSAGHVNAFISNGGSGFVLRHNSVLCEVQPTTNSGGCTADVSFFGDFDPISNAVVDNNLFLANSTGASYCLYAGYTPSKRYGSNPSGVVVTNNVFQRGSSNKCGIYGPVTSFLEGNGNVWTGNVWQNDGTPVNAAR